MDGIEENPVSHAACLEMSESMMVVEKFSKENRRKKVMWGRCTPVILSTMK